MSNRGASAFDRASRARSGAVQLHLAELHAGIGDAHASQKAATAAILAHETGLGILQRLLAKDPKNTKWGKQLALFETKIEALRYGAK